MTDLRARPLTKETFLPFGDVIELQDTPNKIINQGMCGRHHDLAQMDFSDGRAGLSLFDAQPRTLPYQLEMVERHPDGSQAFIPMTDSAFLVVVAKDLSGQPDVPTAFLTEPGQAINLHRNTWHGVLTPLSKPGLFAVIDRIGDRPNLEEFWFETPYMVVSA